MVIRGAFVSECDTMFIQVRFYHPGSSFLKDMRLRLEFHVGTPEYMCMWGEQIDPINLSPIFVQTLDFWP